MVLLGDVSRRFLETVRSQFAIASSKLVESVYFYHQVMRSL
jgi:hypothetical protein